MSGSPTTRWSRPPSWRPGTCATTSCPTARSTSWTRPAPASACGRRAGRSRSASPKSRSSKSASARSRTWSRGLPGFPAKQASSSDRDRLRSLEEALGRVVFGQDEAVGTVARAIKRSRAGLGQPERPAGCFLFTGPDRRRQDRTRQTARAAPRQRVHPLRHERVHGEARGRPADRRAARLRRVRAGRAARRCRPPASLRGAAARRNREGAPRHLQHPAAGDGSRDADRQQRPQGGLPPGRPDHDLERRLARAERRVRSASGIRGVPTARWTTGRRPRSSARNPRSRRSSARSSATASMPSCRSVRCRQA